VVLPCMEIMCSSNLATIVVCTLRSEESQQSTSLGTADPTHTVFFIGEM
jgi:hypothetical protein